MSTLVPSSPIKILIADDSNTDRLLLKTLLTKQGHEVVVASDGVEAVEVFFQEQPTVVLMDALMPRMDGFEAAQKIKLLAGEDFVPIIFLTSLQEADSLARCLDAGGDDFLSKPYNSVILQAKINAFTRMREMHSTVKLQRDEIAAHNNRLMREQEVAKRVFDKVAHGGCLDAPNIQYSLSPIAIFNGDVALAGVSPAGNLLVLLGDFTGHGLDAAIGAMPLAQSFYSLLDKGFSMQDIMAEVNTKLNEVLPVGVFCCAIVAEINFTTGTMRVLNAGLPDAYIYTPSTAVIRRLASHHLPLGVRPILDFNNSVRTYEIEDNDRLYLWTDGILEAENDHGEMFGDTRLLEVFKKNTNAENLFTELNIAVNSYISQDTIGDDISLVEVKMVPPEQFKIERPKVVTDEQAGPRDWSLRYELRPDTLRDFDPLPILLNILLSVPFLRNSGGQIYTVMAELYANALEHGVLGLESSMKNSTAGFNQYYQLRQQRLEQLAEGLITVELDYKGSLQGGVLKITVEDSGDGFDHQGFLVASSEAPYSGRGISLLLSICQSVEYVGRGNRVCATFAWGKE